MLDTSGILRAGWDFPATANQTINSEIVARIASGLQALRGRSDDCSQEANSVAPAYARLRAQALATTARHMPSRSNIPDSGFGSCRARSGCPTGACADA